MARLARLLPAAALISLAACSDSTSPSSVNPQQLSDRLATLTSTFEDNGAFTSLLVLSSHFPSYGGSALVQRSMPLFRSSVSPRDFRRLAPVAAANALRGPDDVQALFPANVLGKTLVWDTQTSEYVIGNQTGAPANGVRLLIYFIDTQTSAPSLPLNQIGYVDLTDESTAQFDRLGVLLKLFGQTVADYDITQTIQTNFSELSAVGRLHSADLGEFADFDLSTGESSDGTTFAMSQNITGSDGTHLFVGVDGDATGEDFEMVVGSGSNELAILTSIGANDVTTGTVQYNGTTVATISGTGENLQFNGVNGNALDDEDQAALALIMIQGLLFAFFLSIGIFGPAFIVF